MISNGFEVPLRVDGGAGAGARGGGLRAGRRPATGRGAQQRHVDID